MLKVLCNKCKKELEENEPFILIHTTFVDLKKSYIEESKGYHLHHTCWDELTLEEK